jgi:hypothetical protein
MGYKNINKLLAVTHEYQSTNPRRQIAVVSTGLNDLLTSESLDALRAPGDFGIIKNV